MMPRRSTLLAFGVALQGCAVQTAQMYAGPALPADQQVVLKTATGNVRILGVDGESSGLHRGFLGLDRTENRLGYHAERAFTVYLRPGKHTVRAAREKGNSVAEGDLWFVGAPGETYILRARIEGYSVLFSIEAANAGSPGGVRGSPDEPN